MRFTAIVQFEVEMVLDAYGMNEDNSLKQVREEAIEVAKDYIRSRIYPKSWVKPPHVSQLTIG